MLRHCSRLQQRKQVGPEIARSQAARVASFAHRALLTYESLPSGSTTFNPFKVGSCPIDLKGQQVGLDDQFEFGASLAGLQQLARLDSARLDFSCALDKLLYRSICIGLQFKRPCEVVKGCEILEKRMSEARRLAVNDMLALALSAAVSGCRALLEGFECTDRSLYLWELANQAEGAMKRIHDLIGVSKCANQVKKYRRRLCAVLYRASSWHISENRDEDTISAMFECARSVLQRVDKDLRLSHNLPLREIEII